ncbi:MAG: hypothetical protein PHG35_06655 [Dehalococcoidales bacterium]|nr:hypothetical protein [Dehalococcoidales bacterium]
MAETKYGDLVRTLKYIEGRGGANAKQMTFMTGEQMQGFELNFVIGVYDEPGDWAPDMGAHIHPFDECLIFFGYDDKDMSILGADMSLAVGKEYEVHKFNTPLVAAAPANLPHCPLITEKPYRPFGHFHLALSGTYAGSGVPKEGTTDGNKYSYLFHPFQVEKGLGGANAVQRVAAEGKDLAGIAVNFSIGLHNQTGDWYPGKGSQIHAYDEVMVFIGHKTEDLSYLGAEITVAIGEEKEKHTFDVPTAVVLPKGTPHLPITCNKLERPYSVVQVGLSPKYDVAWV